MKLRAYYTVIAGALAALLTGPSAQAQGQGRPTSLPLNTDPTAISPGIASQLGSDAQAVAGGEPGAEEGVSRSYFPYYESITEGASGASGASGARRLRLAPPFYLEQTRLLPPLPRAFDADGPRDEESLSGLLFYHRRSPRIDADVLFPLFWSERRDDAHTLTLGPLHLESSPRHWDNWLAPLWFSGESTSGGYFHAPLLLTTTSFDNAGALAVSGPYFRTRTGAAVQRGVVPFWFNGDNGDDEGNRRKFTLIPPLFYFHHEHELNDDTLTVAGPLLWRKTGAAKRFFAMPLWFDVAVEEGDPEKEEHYRTLFPLFHVASGPGMRALVLPGFVSRHTPTTDTLYTPFYTRADTQSGARTLQLAGPVIPLWFHREDRDLHSTTWGLAPFFARHDTPSVHAWYTLLAAHHEREGYGSTTFIAPSFQLSLRHDGWAANLHPLIYTGRTGAESHAVVAPLYWDFDDAEGRSTVGFPLFWRFENHVEGRSSMLAVNVFHQQKRVVGGVATQTHVFPVVGWGTGPDSSFWSLLFGLAGHERVGREHTARALWIPFRWQDENLEARHGLAPIGPLPL